MIIIKIIIFLFILLYFIRIDIIKCHKNKKLKDILLIKRKREFIKKIIENITFVNLLSENYRYLTNGRITVFANADNSVLKSVATSLGNNAFAGANNIYWMEGGLGQNMAKDLVRFFYTGYAAASVSAFFISTLLC